jgi:2-keto-myo-inositol isomerase
MSQLPKTIPTMPTCQLLPRRSLFGLPMWAIVAGLHQSLLASPVNHLLENNMQTDTDHQAEPSARGLPAALPYRPRYCLNTSTINGSQMPLRQQLKIAAEAGYDSVELWLRDIEKFIQDGGDLAALRSEITDLGLAVDGAIGFSRWIVDDAQERAAALEQFRKDAESLRELGAVRIAAPPVGATGPDRLDLDQIAERYRDLLELGVRFEVIPQLELWGFSKNLSTLPELLYVAAAASHPRACLLLDIYHLYKGGSDFSNMNLVPAANMACLHVNDYPSDPDRQAISDKDRVYPGDGVAPVSDILRTFFRAGFQGALSLELFNRSYWELPPEQVARTGLEKMKQIVDAITDAP